MGGHAAWIAVTAPAGGKTVYAGDRWTFCLRLLTVSSMCHNLSISFFRVKEQKNNKPIGCETPIGLLSKEVSLNPAVQPIELYPPFRILFYLVNCM